MARKLGEVHTLAKAKGIVLSFHPRRWDFRPLEGTPIYKRMLALLPGDAQLTYSVYSSLGAGSTPEEILQTYAGRVDLVHFKDRRKMSGNRDMLVPLGEGEVDWEPIAAACRKAGVKYIFTEQERWTRDPFDCAAASFRCLERLKL